MYILSFQLKIKFLIRQNDIFYYISKPNFEYFPVTFINTNKRLL